MSREFSRFMTQGTNLLAAPTGNFDPGESRAARRSCLRGGEVQLDSFDELGLTKLDQLLLRPDLPFLKLQYRQHVRQARLILQPAKPRRYSPRPVVETADSLAAAFD